MKAIVKKHLILGIIGAGITASAAADEARLLRFPATNGSEVVFSYAGDLYKVPIEGGEAKALTSHIGYEMFARFSPDGKHIAFTGEYDGNREVYLMPSIGGEPVRLTYTSTNGRDELGDRMGPNNIVVNWTPDGNIVYRNRIGESFTGKMWTVSPKGGMPTQIPLPEGGWCSFSPDGKKMAYNRVMREFRTWKYYRGGMADDVWIYDQSSKTVENITNNDAQDIFPMWIGDEIFFASDRDNTMNLFVYNTKSKQTDKVTNFTDFDVKFPSSNGSIIVFENGGYIYKFDPKSRKSEKITIYINSDNREARAERKNVGNKVTNLSISDNGTRAVVTARGEVFDTPIKDGVVKNITRTAGSNDREGEISPDGKYIAYIGDGTGETEVYLYDLGNGTTRQLTKDNDTYIRTLYWTPDSKKILYTDRRNRLVEVDPVSGSKRTLITQPESEIRTVRFSPDNQWIATTRSGENNMSVIYLHNLSTGKEYAVTEKWYDSSSPIFSEDGKYLIFTSDRDLTPIYSSVEWNYAYGNMSAVYMTMLASDTPSPLMLKPSAETDEPAKGKDEKADNSTVTVKIDAEGLSDRIVKLPIDNGSMARPVYCDGSKLYYSSGRTLRVFDLISGKDSESAEGQLVATSPKGKKAIFRKGGDYYVASFPAEKVSLNEKLDLSNLVSVADYSQEWAQIYDEVWRAFRDGFYLENMHGADWKALKEKYAALLPYAKTRLDLNYIIGELISELACGHAYVTIGEYNKPKRIQMGLLGAEISVDKSGYFKIDRILPGAPYRKELRSPLTEPGLEVKAGDYITAIDGVPTNSVDNIYKLLIGKAEVATELTINSTASAGGRPIVIKPIADEDMLYHNEWVLNNIKKVEKATNGRVGYIYIPDMGPEGLNEFVRFFYPQLDKEALIIDDRGNGGGNVSPMIIERLQREVYRRTMSRTSSRTGNVPDATLHGPKVLLVDKYSASDGDLFPWSFKATGLGTVIGTRTWGGIVGISGSLPYIDGTDVRVPFFTNFDAKSGQWIVENHGVDPDIIVDNDPILEQQGIDQQLDKAIEVIMEQLKNRKPLPGVPAPRTYKDLGVDNK